MSLISSVVTISFAAAVMAGQGMARTAPVGNGAVIGVQAGACPFGTPETHAIVARFLSAPGYAHSRNAHGIPVLDTNDIHEVSGPSAGHVCSSIFKSVSDSLLDHGRGHYSYSILQAGNLYFLVFQPKRHTRASSAQQNGAWVQTGFVPLYVVDDTFRIIATAAM